MEASEQRPIVSEYYGETLKTSADLKTSACCPIDAVPAKHRAILSKLHPFVTSRFYGCGSPIPDGLSGQTVLDLGCGTGRDAFLAAALAGQSGRVIGVDMTDSQLQVARDTEQFHADTFFGEGSKPNTDFRKGFIEDLRSAAVGDAEVDVVISNCVCNLSTDKKAVFSEVARVLREGGEFYFSDVYADRRLPEEAQKHPVLVAECLGGALYLEDFRRVMAEVGFKDIRIVTSGPIEVRDEKLKALVPEVRFHSITTRAFKIAALEDRRENYGQFATYSSCCGSGLKLDVDYDFLKGVPLPVDANTAAILQKSRFSGKFKVTEAGAHQGLFSPEVEGGALAGMIYSSKQQKSACCPSAKNEKESSSRCATVSGTENGSREEAGSYTPGRAEAVKSAEVKSNGCAPGSSSSCC